MTSRPDTGSSAPRRAYIDWARGLAVLFMVHAHVLDAWTLRSERATPLYGYLTFVGGLAAPLFLWLAGVALVMAAERALSRGSTRAAAASGVFWRGVQIFGLAFLFRLQAFIVSPGNPLVSLLRVDILNIMGPAMAGAAVVWRYSQGRRRAVVASVLIAVALAMVTPVVRTAEWLTSLPSVVQWYVSPAGNHSTFTLFPWAGFVFAGAACGAWLAGVDAVRERWSLRWFGLAGLLVLAASMYASTLPSIYQHSSFWTTSPTYFGARVGLMMALLAMLSAAAPLAASLPSAAHVLQRFGRSSLFVYWIHVELVYGYATLWVHHRLPLWGTGLAFVVFLALMYAAIDVRDRVAAGWRARSAGSTPAHPVRA